MFNSRWQNPRYQTSQNYPFKNNKCCVYQDRNNPNGPTYGICVPLFVKCHVAENGFVKVAEYEVPYNCFGCVMYGR
ncbi:hypothetical protein V1503_05310 [Bacillus sp. SCS-151]|uniref:hypothetical protein n=1 Tax=Nanhaiella sioensis TaxID=3115293 RepID=UPI00397B73E5